MLTLHLFNPENDLALAADERNYTPKAAALALADAGAMLPAWWAAGGDAVLADESHAAEAEWLRANYGLDCRVAGREIAAECGRCDPWGWSRYAAARFERAGVPADVLPTPRRLDTLRRLSGRAAASIVNEMIGSPAALVESDADKACKAIAAMGGDCYVKSPWSSSGRGVFHAAAMPAATLRRQVAGIIRRQGYVTVERAHAKALDFASLWSCADGRAVLTGLSLFTTVDRCAYTGNVVAPQAAISDMITRHVPADALDAALGSLADALGRVFAPVYDGVLGVDMMATRSGLVPCVEINLRHTMGMVAQAVAERLDVGRPMRFVVDHAPQSQSGAVPLLMPRNRFAFLLRDL